MKIMKDRKLFWDEIKMKCKAWSKGVQIKYENTKSQIMKSLKALLICCKKIKTEKYLTLHNQSWVHS